MRLIKMVSVGKSSMGWDGKPFWGLVVQKGPWKSTSTDIKRANQKDELTIGGGIPVGGRMSGQRSAVMTPYQIDASGAPLEPSHHAKRSVVVGAIDMKRQGAKGTRMKSKMTLGARTPVQTGHKMGSAPEEAGPGVPPSEMPDLLEPSDNEDVEMVSTSTSTGPFVSEHRIAESRDASMSTMTPQMQEAGMSTITPQMQEAGTSTMTPESRDASVQSSKPQLSTMRGEPVSFTPNPAKLSMGLGRTVAIEPETQDVIMAAPARQLNVARGGTVSIEPWLQLPASEKFLKTIADYEAKIAEARIEKMSGMDLDKPIIFEKPAGIDIGKGKKVAMSKEALGKEADVKGLPGPSKPGPSIPVRVRSARKKPTPSMIDSQKGKPKKTKSIYQRVTKAAVAKLIKKFSPSELKARAEASKPDDPQYKINKAAWKQYYDSL